MFEVLLETLGKAPYLGLFGAMVLCGLGLPVPEEVILVAAGYLCFTGRAGVWWAGLTCAAGTLLSDFLSFAMGRVFGPRLLRLRAVRALVPHHALGSFDRWFRAHGYTALILARFLPGMRTGAFFTAGAMGLGTRRFGIIDGLGIAAVTPTFVWLGYHFGEEIQELIKLIRKGEAWLLWTLLGSLVLLVLLWKVRQRGRRRRAYASGPTEAFVQPAISPSLAEPAGPSPGDGALANEAAGARAPKTH